MKAIGISFAVVEQELVIDCDGNTLVFGKEQAKVLAEIAQRFVSYGVVSAQDVSYVVEK